MPLIDDCIRSAIRGEAILVVGSGIGFLAKNQAGTTIPAVPGLMKILFAELGEDFDPRAPLDRVAEHFGRNQGFPRLYEILKRQMQAKSVDDNYKELLNSRWRRIYTTNFDNAIELACNSRTAHSIPEDTKSINKGDIIHLNGYIDSIDPVSFDETTNLTSWSYANSEFANSSLSKFFMSDLMGARHIIFVGLSLGSDLDISRILRDDRIPRERVLFVVGPDTKDYDISTMERYGEVSTEGVGLLLDSFERLKDVVEPNSFHLPVSSFFSFVRGSDVHLEQKLDLRDQLLFGKLDLKHMIQAADEKLVGSNQRLIGRAQAVDVADAIAKGEIDKLIIHGDIGTGKTLAAVEISRSLYQQGFDVFWARSNRFDAEEIQRVAE